MFNQFNSLVEAQFYVQISSVQTDWGG